MKIRFYSSQKKLLEFHNHSAATNAQEKKYLRKHQEGKDSHNKSMYVNDTKGDT